MDNFVLRWVQSDGCTPIPAKEEESIGALVGAAPSPCSVFGVSGSSGLVASSSGLLENNEEMNGRFLPEEDPSLLFDDVNFFGGRLKDEEDPVSV